MTLSSMCRETWNPPRSRPGAAAQTRPGLPDVWISRAVVEIFTRMISVARSLWKPAGARLRSGAWEAGGILRRGGEKSRIHSPKGRSRGEVEGEKESVVSGFQV